MPDENENENDEAASQPSERGRLDQAVDLCILAPLGFAADASRLVPKLVERGRGQVKMARAVGKFTVDKAGSVVARTLSQTIPRPFNSPAGETAASDEPPVEPDAEPATADGGREPAQEEVAPSPTLITAPSSLDPSDLAIPDYDSLSASQVVPRLDSLGPAELEAIRVYELGLRGRKTILGKINQLQHGTG